MSSPTSVSLAEINTGDESTTEDIEISSVNVEKIVVSNLSSSFIVKNGETVLSNGAEIGTGATLTISLSDVDTPVTELEQCD